jgi:hypothetical protein
VIGDLEGIDPAALADHYPPSVFARAEISRIITKYAQLV